MPNLVYHSKLREIIYRLDYSLINSKPKDLQGWYSSATHEGYAGDTIFEGHGYRNSAWISVNIIAGEEDLFLHTTLGSTSLNNEISNFEGFKKYSKTSYLYRVDKLNKSVNDLILKIEKDIFPYI